MLTNDNGDVLEEVVGHHYENENDKGRERSGVRSPRSSAATL